MSECPAWGLYPNAAPPPAAAFPRPWGQPGPAWHAGLGQRASSMTLSGRQRQLVKADTQDTRA